MFLSKSDEETTANRKLAKDLVDKWVIIFYCLDYCFFNFSLLCVLRAKREYYHSLRS